MAVSKTSPEFWNKYKGFSYEQFVKEFAKGNSFKMSDIPGYSAEVNKFIPKSFFAYMDKYNGNYKKFGNAWGEVPKGGGTPSDVAKGDVAKAANVLGRTAAMNQMAVLKRNLLAAKDSQTLYDRAANKEGLKNYTQTISDLQAQLKALQDKWK